MFFQQFSLQIKLELIPMAILLCDHDIFHATVMQRYRYKNKRLTVVTFTINVNINT
jgi:hypothetical protein